MRYLKIILIFSFIVSLEAYAKKKQEGISSDATPYCEGGRFFLQSALIPGGGYCFGNENFQFGLNGYFGLVIIGADVTANYTLYPKNKYSPYFGVKVGAALPITVVHQYASLLVGTHFETFFIEIGPMLTKQQRPDRYGGDGENELGLDFRIGWDY